MSNNTKIVYAVVHHTGRMDSDARGQTKKQKSSIRRLDPPRNKEFENPPIPLFQRGNYISPNFFEVVQSPMSFL